LSNTAADISVMQQHT